MTILSHRLSQAIRSKPVQALRTYAQAQNYSPGSPCPPTIRIVEVGPRDGLQNEKAVIPPEVKIELINRLNKAGLRDIESGSYVSPKWVPQMAGTEEVITKMERVPGSHYPVLVPNLKGLELLLETLEKNPVSDGAPPVTDEISVFTAATDAFCKANTNCTISESLTRLEAVTQKALDKGLRVRGYVSVVDTCPYTGKVDPVKVKEVTRALLDMGCYEVSLGDTVGMATPSSITLLLRDIAYGSDPVPIQKLAIHCHDTYGMGAVNSFTAWSAGIGTIDAAVGGLGGCPYSPGATGNVATEDILYMFKDFNVDIHGSPDLLQVAQIGHWISQKLNRRNSSRTGTALMALHERLKLEKERERDGGAAESIKDQA